MPSSERQGVTRKIVAAALEADAQVARLLLTLELSNRGRAAEDLYLRPAFIDACDHALKAVAREPTGLGEDWRYPIAGKFNA